METIKINKDITITVNGEDAVINDTLRGVEIYLGNLDAFKDKLDNIFPEEELSDEERLYNELEDRGIEIYKGYDPYN